MCCVKGSVSCCYVCVLFCVRVRVASEYCCISVCSVSVGFVCDEIVVGSELVECENEVILE